MPPATTGGTLIPAPVPVWLWKLPLTGLMLINVPLDPATIRRLPARIGPE